jgi:hypothetical protein
MDYMLRIRSARVKAPQGSALDVASILCAAPFAFPHMNKAQCDELLSLFLSRPKHTLLKTSKLLYPLERDRQLACPILLKLVEVIDSIFSNETFDRSTVLYMGTQASISLNQFLAEMRLLSPDRHIPSELQRQASVLLQYEEIFEAFADCQYVTTAEVASFFRGELCIGIAQTDVERSGPDCWLALVEKMGYPVKALGEYVGAFCTDHVVERSLYTKKGRQVRTLPDTLCNYAMLLGYFNQQGKMKMFGLEKQGWYGTKWASMAKNSMQFRVDFLVGHGRAPTTRDFIQSTFCKEDWKPVHRLLNRTHPVHARGGSKRSYQNTLDSFVSAVRDTPVVTRDVAVASSIHKSPGELFGDTPVVTNELFGDHKSPGELFGDTSEDDDEEEDEDAVATSIHKSAKEWDAFFHALLEHVAENVMPKEGSFFRPTVWPHTAHTHIPKVPWYLGSHPLI